MSSKVTRKSPSALRVRGKYTRPSPATRRLALFLSGARPPSLRPSSLAGDYVPVLEPGLDVPGNPVDPGALIGPPLRSGTIAGQSPPRYPGAPSAYPVVVPQPRHLRALIQSRGYVHGSIQHNTPYISSINDSINLGTIASVGAPATRSCDQTRFMGLDIRAYFTHMNAPNFNVVNCYSRNLSLVIVYDKQPEAAVPPPSDIFDLDNTGSVTSRCLPKFGTRDRYKILYRKDVVCTARSFPVPPSAFNTVGIPSDYVRFNARIATNLPVCYARTPGGTGPGNISLGNVYLMILGENFSNPLGDQPLTFGYRIDWDYFFTDVK